MKNNLVVFIIVGLGITGVSFFAGLKYQQSKTPNFANMTRDQVNQQRPNRAVSGLDTIQGSIIDKDENSLTIKMTDDSSKIVLVSDLTKINITSQATSEDLKLDSQVIIFGKTNSDGSISAETIQVGSFDNQRFRQ